MATIFKMATLNIIFRHWSSFSFIALKMLQVILKLSVNLETNYIETNKTDFLKEWCYLVMKNWNTKY